MRRWILALLVCVLPLQWSWSAVATVCAHESSCDAHFGHHEHAHAKPAGDGPSSPESVPGDPHTDCQVCHAMGAVVALRSETVPIALRGEPPAVAPAEFQPDPPLVGLLRPPSLRLV